MIFFVQKRKPKIFGFTNVTDRNKKKFHFRYTLNYIYNFRENNAETLVNSKT